MYKESKTWKQIRNEIDWKNIKDYNEDEYKKARNYLDDKYFRAANDYYNRHKEYFEGDKIDDEKAYYYEAKYDDLKDQGYRNMRHLNNVGNSKSSDYIPKSAKRKDTIQKVVGVGTPLVATHLVNRALKRKFPNRRGLRSFNRFIGGNGAIIGGLVGSLPMIDLDSEITGHLNKKNTIAKYRADIKREKNRRLEDRR